MGYPGDSGYIMRTHSSCMGGGGGYYGYQESDPSKYLGSGSHKYPSEGLPNGGALFRGPHGDTACGGSPPDRSHPASNPSNGDRDSPSGGSPSLPCPPGPQACQNHKDLLVEELVI